MEKLNLLTELHNQAHKEAESFYTQGNKAAGTRLRKVMLDIKKLTDEVRKDVQAIKNDEK
ncbi:histone H1 [Paenimyroides tangerinum]|uniref:Histone H1 n=1 Tax=Paenimyroides tangerinum TaxID=2488728 RepID=A0A3P3W8F7_9FLAO|nr:histone H1 [Paenimyroides tangerinum]RRJ90276.1 histone H1 [Paenimyroides tangerinum]